MRKKIVGIVICTLCILVSFPAFSLPAGADSNVKIITSIYGGVPILFQNVSGSIWNIGKNPAYNVTCTLVIIGGFKNDINQTISSNQSELLPKERTGLLINAYGFGPVQITLTVSATNANTSTRIAKGFQMGGFTWIPLSLVTPGILQNFVPWLNWHYS
jgi:hypothetical protein